VNIDAVTVWAIAFVFIVSHVLTFAFQDADGFNRAASLIVHIAQGLRNTNQFASNYTF
jgi:hypothetical protein